MKRPQWITAGLALLAVGGLYAASSNEIFGTKNTVSTSQAAPAANAAHDHELSIDTILVHARENLTVSQQSHLTKLENALLQAPPAEKTHLYHQLARYWYDSVRMFEPYMWYTAEAARLENSEKSLTFAAHLFLNNLKAERSPELKHWKAHEAQDLFERSLKINPANDSAAVGLGAVHLFGAVTNNPMEGIQKIRDVVARDSTNIYALMTLGHASVTSGQMDKAIERYNTVLRLQPGNLEAALSLADAYERMDNKAQAIAWYKKSRQLTDIPGLKEEINKRIIVLSK